MADLTEVLAQLAKLDREATPVPWRADTGGTGWFTITARVRDGIFADEAILCQRAQRETNVAQSRANGDLLALMRNALPDLLAAARQRDELQKAVKAALQDPKVAFVDPNTVRGFRAALAYDGKEEP